MIELKYVFWKVGLSSFVCAFFFFSFSLQPWLSQVVDIVSEMSSYSEMQIIVPISDMPYSLQISSKVFCKRKRYSDTICRNERSSRAVMIVVLGGRMSMMSARFQ